MLHVLQHTLCHTSVVIRHTLLEINFYKLILKLLKLFYTSIDFFNSEPVKLASIGV